jgi:ATP-dependent DNA ligase
MDEGTRIITITNILDLLNLENGSNYKLAILKRCSDNELLERVLKMAYDRVSYTYGITMKNITYTPESGRPISLVQALDILETEFCTRKVTGNAAKVRLEEVLNNLSKEHAIIIEKILGRDLKINLGRTLINKVFPGLIVKPAYMRCDVYSAKTSKNIKFPAIVQLKCDGRFCSAIVDGGKATFVSRSGEEQEFPELAKTFTMLQDGVYIGELLVRGETDRALSNGMINSLLPPHDRIYMICWDYITPEEYINSKGKNTTTYKDRFEKLQSILNKPEFSISRDVVVVPYLHVYTLKTALEQTSSWMNEGYEGAILKDFSNVFKDGTSKTQLKLKLQIDVEMRITGFLEGNKGTKREKTFGSIEFSNDEGTIRGRCSGFTDAQLEDFNSRRPELIGRIMTVQFNDLTKAQGNDFYALSHPRFIELRDDKDTTDTLETAFKLREMAMELK